MADGLAQQALLDREPDLDVVCLDDNRRGVVAGRRFAFRFGGQQVLGVGVLGSGKHFFGDVFLDDLAAGHDADPVGDFPDDAKIVGDEQHRHAALALKLLQQQKDFGLDRDIQSGGRFVGDQQIRLICQGHGDHDALALTARKLVRVAGEPGFRLLDMDLMQKLQHPVAGGLVAHAAMDFQDLADLALHRVQRIERRHRLLENHRNVVAAHPAQVGLVGDQADPRRRNNTLPCGV